MGIYCTSEQTNLTEHISMTRTAVLILPTKMKLKEFVRCPWVAMNDHTASK